MRGEGSSCGPSTGSGSQKASNEGSVDERMAEAAQELNSPVKGRQTRKRVNARVNAMVQVEPWLGLARSSQALPCLLARFSCNSSRLEGVGRTVRGTRCSTFHRFWTTDSPDVTRGREVPRAESGHLPGSESRRQQATRPQQLLLLECVCVRACLCVCVSWQLLTVSLAWAPRNSRAMRAAAPRRAHMAVRRQLRRSMCRLALSTLSSPAPSQLHVISRRLHPPGCSGPQTSDSPMLPSFHMLLGPRLQSAPRV